MTIEDAIRRAKILGQSRLQRQEAEAAPAPAPDRVAPRPVREPGLRFDPLKKVEISATACELNNILLTDSKLREFPAADAAYRLLRSRLANRVKRNNWFSLAVASPTQGDGKSVTAVNLAVSVAREKQKPVFLIDLDMRNPSVCRFLGIRDIRPLPEYLQGLARPEDVLFETSFPSLYVAGALAPTESASELLAGPKFSDLLAHIRLRSPDAAVIVDMPPINVTDEALLVAPRVDAFLMVVSEGKTERSQLAKALSTLSEFTIAGVVVNKSSESQTAGYEHYTAA
jgi:capsular exopolysaccharide synthesis family protein